MSTKDFPGSPDSMLLLQRMQVQSLVGELRSYMPHGAGKKRKKMSAK